MTWTDSMGGAWETASNWSGSTIPNSTGESANINLAGTYTVTLGSSYSINALNMNDAGATLAMSAGTLNLSGTFASTITAGTLTLNSSYITGNGTSSAYVFNNAGTISTVGTSTSEIYGAGPNGLNFTNSGMVNVTSGILYLGNNSTDTVHNSGTITATNGTLILDGGAASLINTGTVTAGMGGVINIGGAFTTADLGSINATSGTVNITGTLTNTSSTLNAPTGGGVFTLNGGLINGGSIASGALGFGTSSGVLENTTLNGSLSLLTSHNFGVEGTTFAGGTLTFQDNTVYLDGLNGSTALTIAAGETLTGNVTLQGSAIDIMVENSGTITETSSSNSIYSNQGIVLDNLSGGLISVTSGTLYLGNGTADIINNHAGGILNADGGNMNVGYGGGTVSNAGTIEATVAGSTLTLGYGSAGTWTNTGTILATNGATIDLGGTFSNSNLTSGTINGTAGTINITGTLNNSTLAAPNGGGIFTLYGGTIVGGTVPSGTLAFGTTIGTLNGVTLSGNFSPASGVSMTAENGSTFTGGTLTFGDGFVYLGGTSGTTALTIAAGETVTGDVTFQASGATNLTLKNNGTIAQTSSSNSIYGNQAGFVFDNNSGGLVSNSSGTLYLGNGSSDTINNAAGAVINADGGTIYAGYGGGTFTNAGTVEATTAASSVTIGYYSGGSWTNTGTILATNGGTINLAGTFSNATLTNGTINGTGGTINITGTLNNSTLVAPNGGGAFTLYGGTIVGGTVPTGTITFGASNGFLNGVALTGNNTVASGHSFTVENDTTFSGGTLTMGDGFIYLGGPASSTALTIAAGETVTGNVTFQGNGGTNQTLVNNGTIAQTSGSNSIYSSQAGFVFNNNSGALVSNSSGTLYLGNSAADTINNASGATINADGGTIYAGYGGSTFTNAGTIEATTAASAVTIGYYTGGSWTNTGSIIASGGGTVNLGGSFTNATLTNGTINGTGGTINITGTLTNSTLAAPNGGGAFTLDGGTIVGGTVPTGTITFGSNSNSTLNGVALTGANTVASGSSFHVENGTTFSGGTLTMVDGFIYLDGTAGTALTIASGETVTGNLTLQAQVGNLTVQNNGTFTNSSGSNSIYSSQAGFAFNNNSGAVLSSTGGTLYVGNGPNDTITNASGAIVDAAGGNINAGYGGAVFNNAGTAEATTTGSILTLGYNGYSDWSNTGTLKASGGGIIDFGGNFLTSNLTSGTILGSGGSLNITGILSNTSATLVAPNSGIYTLYGGTITGGVVNSGALTFSNVGGSTLNGVTMNGNVAFPSAQALVNVENGTSFTGGTTTFVTTANDATINLVAAGTDLTLAAGEIWTGSFYVQGNVAGSVMVNNGTIDFTANSNGIYSNSNGMTFTNNGTINVTNAGTTASLSYYALDTFANTTGGVVTVNAGALNLGTYQGNWLNVGTLTATNGGTINFGGTYTTPDFGGSISGAGGTLNLLGTFTNTGFTLNPPASGIYTLHGATITGGTIASGALTFGSAGGTLSGVSLNGNFSTPNSSNYFLVTNGTTFTGGTTSFATGGDNATVDLSDAGNDLTLSSSETWTGSFYVQGNVAGSTMVNNGTIDFTANANGIYSNSNGMTITNNGAINVTGASTTASLSYYALDTFTNSAAGAVTVNAGTLNLGSYLGNWVNLGTLTATNGGTINFGGDYVTSDFGGTINGSAGTLNLLGSFTNTGGTLNLPASGIYTLHGATITGGTIASGALTFGNNGGTLSGVTMSGSFSFPAAASAYFTATNGTIFSGGTTSFATSSDFATVDLTGAGTDLTVASGATWTGSFYVQGNTAGSAMLNNGTIAFTANANGIYSNSYGMTFNNYGTVSVTGASTSATLGYYTADNVTNEATGTMTVNAGTLKIGGSQASWNNLGTITATNGGTVQFGGVYSTQDLGGTINGSGGTLDLLGTFDNAGGNLAAPASGVYTLDGAVITLGSVSSGALTFSNGGGTLSGVVMNGNFTLPAAANASFTVTGGTTFIGGTTTFSSSGNYDSVFVTGAGNDLTLAPSETWTGIINLQAQTAGAAISNLGTIHITGGSDAFYGNGGGFTFTNSGTILNNGGTVYIGEEAGDVYTQASAAELETIGGSVVIGYGGSTSNLASNTLTSGIWAASGGGTIDFYGTTNAIVTNDATLVLDGSSSNIQTRSGSGGTYQTVDATLATNNGTLEVLTNRNFTGANAFANNGSLMLGGGTFTESSFTSGSGSSIAGTGTIAVTAGAFTIGSGVTVSPGGSTAGTFVGTLSLNPSGGTVLGGGGTIVFDVENAAGAAGTGYDTLATSGSASISATSVSPFTIDLASINSGTGAPGLATFTNTNSYQWTLLSSSSLSNFNTADFTLNTSGFTNPFGTGHFFLSSDGSDLFVNFTPVPEPSTWALMGGGAAALGVLGWRRRRARAA